MRNQVRSRFMRRIFATSFAAVDPRYVAKAEKKGCGRNTTREAFEVLTGVRRSWSTRR